MPDSSGPSQVIKTSCSRMDHGGCGLRVEVQGGQIRKIRGNPLSPISLGYICPKGLASVERTHHPDRLKHPLIQQGARGQGSGALAGGLLG